MEEAQGKNITVVGQEIISKYMQKGYRSWPTLLVGNKNPSIMRNVCISRLSMKLQMKEIWFKNKMLSATHCLKDQYNNYSWRIEELKQSIIKTKYTFSLLIFEIEFAFSIILNCVYKEADSAGKKLRFAIRHRNNKIFCHVIKFYSQ